MIKLDAVSIFLCNYLDVEESYIFLDSRKADIVEMRRIFHYLSNKYTNYTRSEIGGYYKDNLFNHSTVSYSIKTTKNLRESDKKYRDDIDILESVFVKYLINRNNNIENIDFFKDKLLLKLEKIKVSINEFNKLLFEFSNKI